jgi:hypothetical protein
MIADKLSHYFKRFLNNINNINNINIDEFIIIKLNLA